MNIFIIAVIVLGVISLISGYAGCYEMSFGIEINRFNSPFYKIGLFSERYYLNDGEVEDEIILGLFLVNIVITFWRPGFEA